MDLIQEIENKKAEMTPGEKAVADYVLEFPFDVVRYDSTGLADVAGTSRSNLVRFCKKLGFNGYLDFKYELNRSLQEQSYQNQPQEHQDTVIDKYIGLMQDMEPLLRSSELKQAVELVLNAKRITIFGRLHSYLPAQQLAFRMTRSTLYANADENYEYLVNLANYGTSEDLLIVFSVSGRKHEFESNFREMHRRGVPIILITFASRTPLSKFSAITFKLPSAIQTYSRDMMDDAPMFFMFIEVLMSAIHQKLAGRTGWQIEKTVKNQEEKDTEDKGKGKDMEEQAA